MSKISPSFVRQNLYNILDWVVRGCNRARISTKDGEAILVSAKEFDSMQAKADIMAADTREAIQHHLMVAAKFRKLKEEKRKDIFDVKTGRKKK